MKFYSDYYGQDFPDIETVIPQRTLRNRKRGNKISSYARQNQKTYKALNDYIMQMDSSNVAFDYAINLRAKLQNCCSHTLIREHKNPKTFEFIGAHTCKHKLCHICNAERSRAIRRKYLRYFHKNEFIDRKTGEVHSRSDFDFMHLTLTVPHTNEKGFRNKRWYADELMKEFNWMRKKQWWQKMVFAGEFGVEVTKNQNGFHIHIHALLIVHKGRQNRNKLHREILLQWNKQTVSDYQRTFNDESKASIAKSNSLLTIEDIESLNPQGSTLISLESLYVYSRYKQAQTDKWDNEKALWKHYVNSEDETDLVKGVMECIKYHFEPMCLNKEDGSYDFDLMCEILPQIQGKPLYRKFGNFHGVKELNVIDADIEDIQETLEETANDEVIHPITCEPLSRSEYHYVIIAARNIHYDSKNNFKPFLRKGVRKRYVDAPTLGRALKNMALLSLQDAVKFKAKRKELLEIELYQIDNNDFFFYNN